jgi:cytosine/adenosine deaminase-related metal-dependent hydrolase
MIALTGATVVVSLDPAEVVDATVVIDAGRVVTLTPSPPPGIATIDCSGCLVIPGNTCAHTHAYSSLARGMPYRLEPPRDFVEILRRVWWRLDRALDESSIRASARVAAMEALLAGTTTLFDHHASPGVIDGSLDIVADAFEELGVRSVLAYETTDRDGPGRDRATAACTSTSPRTPRTNGTPRQPMAPGSSGASSVAGVSSRRRSSPTGCIWTMRRRRSSVPPMRPWSTTRDPT